MIVIGLLIPFLGTVLGAACVYLLQDELPERLRKSLLGFASGVMVAASVWSLLLPSIDLSAELGWFSFVPAAVGLAVGMAFLLLLDQLIPHLHLGAEQPEGPVADLHRSTMLILAVTLHNIPEGMAVGVTFAGAINGNSAMTIASAMVLSIGIAIQNFPEGAIISMPLRSGGLGKHKAFAYGVLSGAVEPIGAAVTILLTGFLLMLLPYLLAFAAGAMLYVVIEELIPEASAGDHTNLSTISFGGGFLLMMALDLLCG